MIFAEDAPWKAYVYLAFYLEVFNTVVTRDWILGSKMQQTGRDFQSGLIMQL